MLRSRIGSSTGKLRVAVPVLSVCMLFSSFLYASPAAETGAESVVIKNTQADDRAALESILKKNTRCLKCHSRDKFKSLENGEEMVLQVPREEYTSSAHGEVDCVSCHQAIGNRKHPSRRTNISINSQRDYSVELNQSCRDCHGKKYTQYEGSIHALLVAQGSATAPVCTDCHSAHAVETMAVYQPVTGLPCKNCHVEIFAAYATSVHGEARKNGNVIQDSHIQAPICADCHRTHAVTAVAIDDNLRSACIGCHEGVNRAHDQWLPNAGLHLDVVSCAACHAPVAERRIDLRLHDNVAQVPVGQREDHESFQQQLQAINKQGGSVDSLDLWNLVRERGPQGQAIDITLRGRMEVTSGVEAHRLASRNLAVRACDSCHQSGSGPFQDVTVSITRPDGRTLHYKADREILSAVASVGSIGNFYALGGTRVKLLDVLLLLGLLIGFAIPIAHFALGRIIKKNKEKGEQ